MKSNKLIPISEQLPPICNRVQLSYGLFGIRSAVCDEWISDGWLLKSGIWSIKQATNVTPQSKPTHWREIPFPKSNLSDKIKELSDFREYRREYLQEPVTHTDK